jgi:transketolase
MPAPPLFSAQDDQYKEQVLPQSLRARVAIEAAHEDYWMKYTGLDGDVIGMSTFGKSAPADELFNFFGFTEENAISKMLSAIDKNRSSLAK